MDFDQQVLVAIYLGGIGVAKQDGGVWIEDDAGAWDAIAGLQAGPPVKGNGLRAAGKQHRAFFDNGP